MSIRVPSFTPALALAMSLSIPAARAADQVPGQVNSMQDAVSQGAALFTHAHFGGTGTCETCHKEAGLAGSTLPDGTPVPALTGAAAEFPKYIPRAHQVITLTMQLMSCVAGGMQGKPPAFGSPELVNLETYVTSLSKGATMGKQFN